MKNLGLILIALFISGNLIAQEPISKKAPYLGTWIFDGNHDNAPSILQDLPQYQLEFKSGEKYSCISFPAHDELGYPQPNYFVAKIKGGFMTGQITHSPGSTLETKETVKFKFSHDLITDQFTIIWEGKSYVYIRK